MIQNEETMSLNYVAERIAEKTGNVFVAALGNLPRGGRLLTVELLIDSSDPNFPVLQQMAALHAKADETDDGTLRPRGFGLRSAAGFALGEQSTYKVDGVDRFGAFACKPVDGAVELVEASPVRTTISDAARERLAKLGIK